MVIVINSEHFKTILTRLLKWVKILKLKKYFQKSTRKTVKNASDYESAFKLDLKNGKKNFLFYILTHKNKNCDIEVLFSACCFLMRERTVIKLNLFKENKWNKKHWFLIKFYEELHLKRENFRYHLLQEDNL